MKKILLNLLRISVSFGLIFYLLYIADVSKIMVILKSLNIWGFFLAVVVCLLSLLIMAMRWRVLNLSHGIQTRTSQLYVFYLIGLFFNNFLPTSIGGDLARVFYLSKSSKNRSASIGTVFLERIIGLLATLTLAFVSLFWLIQYFHSNRIIYVTMIIIGIIAIFLASIMSRRLYKRFNGLISLITFYEIGDKIIKVLDTLHFYRNKKSILLKTYLYSILSQFLLILMNFALARALGLTGVTLGYLILVVPITFVIGLVPSINGIGVRDTGYLILLSRQGLETSQILSLSLTVTFVPILISLVGGIFLMLYRQKGIEGPHLKEEKVT
ncbi:MAG: flippase-like domain-containing protein [bacterium]|nr:MAG: flippase-like domain-containing protein [bacterium]